MGLMKMRESILRRMWDVSSFMKGFKQDFTLAGRRIKLAMSGEVENIRAAGHGLLHRFDGRGAFGIAYLNDRFACGLVERRDRVLNGLLVFVNR